MPRKPTGQVVAPQGGRAWAIRFRAYGVRRYLTLGTPENGWTRARAEAKLRHVLADVERGVWTPEDEPAARSNDPDPTLREFASAWLWTKEPELRDRTIAAYTWALELHLLPFFADHRLSEITEEEVDRYRAMKLREGQRERDAGRRHGLAPNAVNTTIVRLAQILNLAVEYRKLEYNPARGRHRLAKPTQPRRTYVAPEQLGALLDASDHHLARWWRRSPVRACGSGRHARSTGASSTSQPAPSSWSRRRRRGRGPRGGPSNRASRGAPDFARA